MNRLTFEQSVKALSKPPQKRVEGKHEKLEKEQKNDKHKKMEKIKQMKNNIFK